MNPTRDVVIVGGGVMGCSAAYHLARRGVAVTVLEKAGIGSGSTGRSSGIIRQHYSNELTARMALHSLRVFQHFDGEVGGDCGFRQTGFVMMVPESDRAGLEANIALQQSLGIRTELLSPESLDAMVPGIDAGDLVAAAHEPESGYADPHLTTVAYADAARRHGAEVIANRGVTGIRFIGGAVVGVDTTAGSIDAPVVVNCAGPWGARVAAMAGVIVPINSCRVQIALFRHPANQPAVHPVVFDFAHATYIRTETGNLTLAGLMDPAEADAIVDPDDYAEHVDDEFVADMAARLLGRYPSLERAESTGGYAGLYAVTPDWHPIIDEMPRGSGSFICSGFSGHGFKLAPAVGVMVADLVTRESSPMFDPDLFSGTRYAEGREVRGQYEYSITG